MARMNIKWKCEGFNKPNELQICENETTERFYLVFTQVVEEFLDLNLYFLHTVFSFVL